MVSFNFRLTLKLSLLLFLVDPAYLISQTKFQNLTIKHGLPSNRIYDCKKDMYGFFWFVSDRGICRYDGVKFNLYNYNSHLGLTENNFQKIFIHSKDQILFLSYYGWLYSYSYSTGRFTNISQSKVELKDKSLSNIFRDQSNYWFTTSDGLLKTDLNFEQIKEYKLKEFDQNPTVTNRILSLCKDKKGMFWLGMFSRAIYRFNPETGIFSNKELQGILPVHQQVGSIVTLPNSNYVFVASGGEGMLRINIIDFTIVRWKIDKNNSNSLPSDRVTFLKAQNDSLLWIGTIDGLAKLNLNTNKIDRYSHNPTNPYSLISNGINSLFIDEQNILWVSTFGGVSKLSLLPERFTKISHDPHNRNSITTNTVGNCFEDMYGNLWIGTSNGIDILNPTNGNYYHYVLPKSFPFHSNQEAIKFFADDETMWIGTWGGGISRVILPKNFKAGDKLAFANFYNEANNNNSISSNFVRCFAKDKNGDIWITTWNGGLNKIDSSEKNKNKIRFTRFMENAHEKNSIASNFIEPLLFDSFGNLWLGTGNGIQKVDLDKNKWEMFWIDKQNHGAIINMSINFFEDSNKNIWISSYAGLVKISRSNNDDHSSEIIQGAGQYGIFASVIDRNDVIWFSTHDSKIGKYDTKKKELSFFNMIDETDGFDFYLGSPAIGKNGNIYFAGNSGYLFFNPKSLVQNADQPEVYITVIKLNEEKYFTGKDISLINKLELDYDQRNLSFSFAALNYVHSEANQYKYKLEGHDKNWIMIGNRTEITFANLSPGKYKLRIMGSNNDGVWGTKAASVNMIINPPLWENTYFRIVFLSLIAFGIYTFFNSKIKRLKTEKQKQQEFSRLLIQSQEEERKRLSKEMHDSLGQNLLVIKNQIDFYQQSETKDENDLKELSELVKETISEVKEISSNLHPHQLERLGLIKAIKALANNIQKSGKFVVEIDIDEITRKLSPENEINIYRIIQESFNNILKHSDASEVILTIKNEDLKTEIIIADNGKGFDINEPEIQTMITEGLGLKSIKERVRLLNGTLSFESKPETGTTIKIVF